MSIWRQFENWRDEIHCGSRYDKPWREAEIGERYELFDAVWDKVLKVVTCSESNRDEIEWSLNNNDYDDAPRYYRKANHCK